MDAHPPTDPDEDDGVFICTCSEQGRQEAAALVDEVRTRLDSRLAAISVDMARAGHPAPDMRVTDETLLDEIVLSLDRDFSASIERIGSDHWFGLDARTYDGTYSIAVQ